MDIKWLGHSAFILNMKGIRILTDPYDYTVGYDLPKQQAEIVLCTHDHFDHNYLDAVDEGYLLIDASQKRKEYGIEIEGFETFHDEVKGAKRGADIMFKLCDGEYSLLHCGDVGIIPDDGLMKSLGKIDILLLPIGSVFTINGAEAAEFVRRLQPGIVIPMHYKTKACKFDIDGIEPFLAAIGGDYKIERLNGTEFTVKADMLDKRVIEMQYE